MQEAIFNSAKGTQKWHSSSFSPIQLSNWAAVSNTHSTSQSLTTFYEEKKAQEMSILWENDSDDVGLRPGLKNMYEVMAALLL